MLTSTYNKYVILAILCGSSASASSPHLALHKRMSNIAASALNAQAVTSYLVCQVSVQGKQAAYKLGMAPAPKDCIVPVIIPISSTTSATDSSASATPVVIAETPDATSDNATNTTVITPLLKPIDLSKLPALTATIMQISSSGGNAPCNFTGPSSCEIQALALIGHNVARALHHVDPLTWNDTLADAALTWAKKGLWKHSQGSLFPFPYGENLFSTTSTVSTMTDAVHAFTVEESLYDYRNPGFSEATGHFTQVVWKGTQQVGCASLSVDLDYFHSYTNVTQYYVCTYLPAGNYIDSFATNVFPIVPLKTKA